MIASALSYPYPKRYRAPMSKHAPFITSANAAALARRRSRNGRPKARTQILRMQASLLASATDPSVPANIRAACARSWDVLEERLRIMSGKPLPGQLRPELQALRELRRGRQSAHKALLAINPADLPTGSTGS